MIRTQEEIKQRLKEVDDMFGTQKADLIFYLEFGDAKPFLKDEFVKKVNEGTKEWVKETNPKKEILDYLEFAYEKAENGRGLSAARSMMHFKTWIWLDDKEFYADIVDEIDNYYAYGIPVLDKISSHYGYEKI